jgi:uncharacterized protein (DUF1800 family)
MPGPDLSTHVLSRLGYGPRGDQRIDAKGLDAWIDAQLDPAAPPDADCEVRVAKLPTAGLATAQLATRFPRPKDEDVSIDPPDAPPDGVKTFASPLDDTLVVADDRVRILADLQAEHLLRAVYGAHQLQEVLTAFWLDFFDTAWGPGPIQTLLPAHVRGVIRPNALRSFPALLRAVTQSPAFLYALGNHHNVAAQTDEGFARALLQRYTLGPNGKIADADVSEVARCFTGWSLDAEWGAGTFRFVDALHDGGAKTVFGEGIRAGGGRRDGETALNLVLAQPSTGRWVATRLVRHFVADEPPQDLVAQVAAAFDKTSGDIPAMLRVIVTSAAFRDPAIYGTRVKRPAEYVASALRFLEAETDAGPDLQRWLPRMGAGPFAPGREAATLAAPELAERMRFAMNLAAGAIVGTRWTRTFSNANAVLSAAGALSSSTRRAIGAARPTVARAAGLTLASPEFQKR